MLKVILIGDIGQNRAMINNDRSKNLTTNCIYRSTPCTVFVASLNCTNASCHHNTKTGKMKTQNDYLAIIQQVNHDSTNWVGHRPWQAESQMTGQTFTVPEECPLAAIEIFSSVIPRPGKMIMTLHYFDPVLKNWGPPLSTCSINVDCNESGQWLAFDLPGMQLHKEKVYGFRIESPDTYIGVGEAVGNHNQLPFEQGEEWVFTQRTGSGKHFSYFSLAFKVDRKAA